MSDTKKDGRYLCADVLGCLGVILLLGLQYMQAVNFLDAPVSRESTPYVAVRWFCLSGAMLLSACTGYVMSTKRISWRSFKPLLRLGYIYIICSLCTMLIQKIIFDQEMDFNGILQILYQFTATDTTKFIAMYFALLLASPFLSAAFHDLKTYQARLAFLAVSAGVSTLQPMLIFSGNYLLPEWCKMLAPIAGFIGGAFVKRYAKNHSRIFWFSLLLLVCVLQTLAVMFVCTERGVLYYPQFDSMASLPSLIIALLTLSLFQSKKRGDSGRHSFFAGASGGALPALILGDVMIDFLMPSISENFPDMQGLLLVGLIAVPVIFILCCTVGLFLQMPIFLVRAVTGNAEYEEEEEDEDDIEEIPVKKPKPIRRLEPIPEPVSESVPEPAPEPVPESAPEPAPMPEPMSESVSEPEPIPESEPEPAPKPKKYEHPASLNEILKEQGISAQDTIDSVDDLIAKITK